MIVAITGRPGVGKSTVFSKTVNELKKRGYTVYGFFCPEVRERGVRVGFKIVDIYSGNSGWLALTVDKARELGMPTTGKRIGKYVVIESDAVRVGVEALRRSVEGKAILGIDEIGPMELSVESLRREIIRSITAAERALLVIHRNMSDSEILNLLRMRNAKVYTVTEYNREDLHILLTEELS
mgnify:CR=1 FL=1